MKNNENIYAFIKSIGFEPLKQDISAFFGDYYEIFTNGIFQLRFSSSKSFESIDIKRILPNENWYDLALVKALLHGEKKLNHVATIEEYRFFLQNEFANISELFNGRNYPATKRRLDELENERAEQMFPGKTK